MAATRSTSDHRLVGTDDPRNRPIVLQTGPSGGGPKSHRLRPRTLLGSSAAAVLMVAVLVAGSWSVWAVVGSTAPTGKPAAPLWFSPPAPETSTVDSEAPMATTLSPLSTEDKPARHKEIEEEADHHPHETGSAPTTTPTRSGPSSGEEHRGRGHSGRG